MWRGPGRDPPVWAHLPLLVNEKRQKLSKRRDKVALEGYRADGYIAEAMRNYLMLLGWAPAGDREILPWPVLVDEFRLDEVNLSPAFFDVKKLRAINGTYIRDLPLDEFSLDEFTLSPVFFNEKKWRAINGPYIRDLPLDEFIARSEPWLPPPVAPWRPEAFSAAVYAAVAPLVRTRVAVMSELTDNVDFLFLDEPAFDEASWSKTMTGPAADVAAPPPPPPLPSIPRVASAAPPFNDFCQPSAPPS